MSSFDPVDMLRAGKRVNVDNGEWAKIAQATMETALRAKFGQNPHLLEKLLATDQRHFAEANAYDKYWGIGLGLKDPKLQNKKSWAGKNLLGKQLDSLREHFKTT
jgi:ribA/ribD-fused uncharacterized protein